MCYVAELTFITIITNECVDLRREGSATRSSLPRHRSNEIRNEF